ncbi:TPR repeat protein [mine drainage metagenome]|uniref:TPR repeat protein n=1 Tax=mine drainage metagenome TaxID=410659 RepID=T0YRG1_9ZZZZ
MDSSALLTTFRSDGQRLGVGGAYDNLLRALLAALPRADDWSALVQGLLQQQATGAAIALAEQGLQRHPEQIELRYLLGNGLRMVDERHAAERELRAVLAVQPTHAGAAASLAHLLRGEGRLQAAAQVALDSLPALPTDAQWRDALAFMRECDDARAALDLTRRALKQVPEDGGMHAAAGELALELGRFEQARVHLRRALAMQPQFASGWLRLAAAHRFQRLDEADARLIERAAHASDPSSEAGIAARFAWAKVLADVGAFDQAVPQLRAANAAMRPRVEWSARGFDAFVQRQIAQPAPPPQAQRLGFAPVLIVGLPRTGTTLTASLLARHPEVRNRGELNWLAQLALHVETGGRQVAQMRESATLYAAQLRRDDAPARVIVDKNPLNFRHLGMAAALLPGLRVIHCQRGARATALSIYRQMFAHEDNGYAYDFADIAAFARGEARLMRHWRATLPVPFYALDYTRLVSDTDAVLAELHAFLDLPEAAVGAASTAPGSIRTASVWQARQKVHRDALDAWKPWAPYLPELLDTIPESWA